MNKLYIIVAILATTACLHAQITVTSASFPAAGDTLEYATDLTPGNIAITAPGGPASWDFTNLGPEFNVETAFRPATEGAAFADFPTATLVSVAVDGQGQGETYYASGTDVFANLGFSGTDPTGGLPIQTNFKFQPPVPDRRSPMNFFDVNQAGTNVNIGFATADIPGNILDSLGIPTALVDSIRVRVTATRLDVVDAYGTLAIPGGTYDVLREKRSEYRETRLDIHTFLGWQDITDIIIGGGNAQGFGTDTSIHYLYFSNTEKEIIADVDAGNDGLAAQSVTYKDNGLPNAAEGPLATLPSVSVSPNPASSTATFTLQNLAPGTYWVQVFDSNGRLIFVKNLTQDGNTVHLGALDNGTYFYQIFAEGRKPVASGKLLKINE